MAELPLKIYYNMGSKTIVDSAGLQIADNTLLPKVIFGQKCWVNLKLFATKNATDDYTELPTGMSANIYVDNDYYNPAPVFNLPAGDSDWTPGAVTNEYYYNGLPFTASPTYLYLDGVLATKGTVGTLAAGTWGFDTASGYIYVRLSDNSDPDTHATGYVRIKDTVTTAATSPFISVHGSTFNAANSWWDTDTETFRAPDITVGEISFYIEADTYQYWSRIGSTETGGATIMQIQMLAPSTANLFDMISFTFTCGNKITNTDVELHLASITYTAAEIDAIYAKKISAEDITFSLSTVGPVLTEASGRKARIVLVVDEGDLVLKTQEII